MRIFEIVKKGTTVAYQDCEASIEIDRVLMGLERQFYYANLSLNLFLIAYENVGEHMSRARREADSQRRSEIQKEVEQNYENPYDFDVMEDIRLEADLIFKREQWQSGIRPREFEHSEVLLHARSFLYALDSFDRHLDVLKSVTDVSPVIGELRREFGEKFPDLRYVRNSAHHMEDRSRGLDRRGKPLDLKAINNRMIKSDCGVLVLDGLNGTRYGNTLEDGRYGEVDVSCTSMQALQSIFQRTVDAFEWIGPKCHLPSAR